MSAHVIVKTLTDFDLCPPDRLSIEIDSARRRSGSSGNQFLIAQAHTVLAAVFFAADTVVLKRIYVLFRIPNGRTSVPPTVRPVSHRRKSESTIVSTSERIRQDVIGM
jgi:hypothetical protein